MDFITQNLLGAAAAQAAFSKSLGRRATWLGALGGALPDFDFLLRSFADPAFPPEFHRHFTHAIVFIPVGGLLATLPFLFSKFVRQKFWQAYAAATLACATHALLDCCTSYGTMWYWPFTNRREGWDLIAIIDPLFTIPLLIGVFIAWRRRVAYPAIIALLWCTFYMGLGVVQRQRALGAQRELAQQRGHTIDRGRVFPTIGSLLFWRSVYQSQEQLWADGVRLASIGSPQVTEGRSLPLARFEDLPEHVRAMPRVGEVFRKVSNFADGYTAALPGSQMNGSGLIFIGDMRYSRQTNDFIPIWGIRIDPANSIEPVAWVGWMSSTAEAIDGRKPLK
jgi:inner membrane protein